MPAARTWAQFLYSNLADDGDDDGGGAEGCRVGVVVGVDVDVVVVVPALSNGIDAADGVLTGFSAVDGGSGIVGMLGAGAIVRSGTAQALTTASSRTTVQMTLIENLIQYRFVLRRPSGYL
ncbi:hypothetical protein ALI144C_29590 [Actinosynnema sp. ALI-1.44]|nr:hypothetical protein ALI144C_29590 [Actinosynnema sp. ALI-1.44]